MRYYSYQESEDDEHVYKTFYSEKEILDEFWEAWLAEMNSAGFQKYISKENCINDWCALHWAVPEDIFIHPHYGGKLWAISEYNVLDPNWNFVKLVCLNDDIEFKDAWADIRHMRRIRAEDNTENLTTMW